MNAFIFFSCFYGHIYIFILRHTHKHTQQINVNKYQQLLSSTQERSLVVQNEQGNQFT